MHHKKGDEPRALLHWKAIIVIGVVLQKPGVEHPMKNTDAWLPKRSSLNRLVSESQHRRFSTPEHEQQTPPMVVTYRRYEAAHMHCRKKSIFNFLSNLAYKYAHQPRAAEPAVH
jgi:hypothetical protein